MKLNDLPSVENEKYFNEDFVKEILESGSEEELEKVSILQNWSVEEAERFRHFSRLRRATLDNMKIDLKRRLEENPQTSADELSLGIYWEKIEPQVREAVRTLRAKGYLSSYSGFSGWGDEQIIKFEEPNLPDEEILKLVPAFAERGVKLQVSANEIIFKLEKEISLSEITELWTMIAAAASDLGQAAKDSQLNSAKNFREQQNIK